MPLQPPLQSPFPWFGGKSRVAHNVWSRFGDVPNYVEPFYGSGAVLLRRPTAPGIETINDADGYVANFWRAISQNAQEVAEWADYPVNEADLHARHIWLRARKKTLLRELEANPEYYDTKIAGWWVWGMALWIGGGFCGESGAGPWQVMEQENGTRQLPHLGNAGKGVQRKLLHLGNAGKGVQRKLLHLRDAEQGVVKGGIYDWFDALQERIARVRVCCGDFERVLGPSVTFKHGLTGVFLDPPYSHDERNKKLYAEEDCTAAKRAYAWAVANGENPLLRIAFCGYEGEHEFPPVWTQIRWKADGGYGNQGDNRAKKNRHRETIWFSPHCLKQGLFEMETENETAAS